MRQKIFYGWQVVGAAFVLAVFAWGIGFYGPSVYVAALSARQGWSPSLVAAAVTLHFLASAPLTAALPKAQARFGAVAVTRAGALCSAAGVSAWALADAPWHLIPAALLTATGWAAHGGAAINGIVSPWFDRRRPAALAMAFNGASVGGILVLPLWAWLIARYGFASAGLVVAALTLLVVWPLAGRWFRDTPAARNLFADGGPAAPPPRPIAHGAGPLWRQARFRSLSGAFALALMAQIGLLTVLFTLLAPALGTVGAGWAMSLATVCAVVGRTAVGVLLPEGADRRGAAALNFCVQAVGSALLAWSGGTSPTLLLAGTVLFGLGIGNLLSLPPLIAQAEWPAEQVARVVALIIGVNGAFYAFGPALFGAVLEAFGPVAPPAVAGALQVAAAVTLRLGRR